MVIAVDVFIGSFYWSFIYENININPQDKHLFELWMCRLFHMRLTPKNIFDISHSQNNGYFRSNSKPTEIIYVFCMSNFLNVYLVIFRYFSTSSETLKEVVNSLPSSLININTGNILQIIDIRQMTSPLRCLPVRRRIHFEMLLTTSTSISDIAPEYLYELVSIRKTSRKLGSSSQILLQLSVSWLKPFDDYEFSVSVPVLSGWWLVIYGHFCTYGRLNGPSDLQRYWREVKDETLFRYAHAEIRARVVVICHPKTPPLDHRGALPSFWNRLLVVIINASSRQNFKYVPETHLSNVSFTDKQQLSFKSFIVFLQTYCLGSTVRSLWMAPASKDALLKVRYYHP